MIAVGSTISGKYRLLRLLGDGGMGSVYEAQHEVLGTRVAIKVLHADLARRPGLVDRFLREARVAAQIKSPNVIQVSDVDRTPDGTAYIVMELLEGEPLSSVLERERRIPVPVAVEYTRQILIALEAAHALGAVHRDLKPENVFVTFVGGRPVLKLIDFGIAKLHMADPQAKSLTVAGVVMGTAEYMAPEQARSADQVDARSDLYAVGVMLYEMLAGERPVAGEDARIIAMRVERGEVKPLVHAFPDVPRELAGLVHRAMAARPELRFATATEMRLALESTSLGPGKREPTRPVPAVDALGAGTVLGAPAQAAFAPPPADTRAASIHAAPPATQAPAMAAMPVATGITGPAGSTAYASPSPAFVPPTPPPEVEAAQPPRRRRGPLVALIVLPLLLGIGAVVAYVVTAGREVEVVPTATEPTSPPATTTPATATTESPATATTTAVGPLAPLNTGAPPQPTRPPPHASSTASGTSAPSADTTTPPVLPFPSTLPSGFPPLPSGIPSGFALPSGFPFPPPPPAPSGS